MSSEQTERELIGCGYQGYEFGAGSYPDSICVEGRLHDADDATDSGLVYVDGDDRPCPMCRPLDAIAWWTEQNAMFAEGDETEQETEARAREHAISLVTDIRRNRGVDTDLEAIRAAAQLAKGAEK